MHLKIQIESLSMAYDFEFKPNNGQIIVVVIQSETNINKSAAGYAILQDSTHLLKLIDAIKYLSANLERSSLVILDGICSTFSYEDADISCKCSFNKPEPHTQAAQIMSYFYAIIAEISDAIPFLKNFEVY